MPEPSSFEAAMAAIELDGVAVKSLMDETISSGVAAVAVAVAMIALVAAARANFASSLEAILRPQGSACVFNCFSVMSCFGSLGFFHSPSWASVICWF